MMIREYRDTDEQEWLRCRVVSFLDSSYYQDVKTEKEHYSHPSISLVALEDTTIIGLLEIEVDADDITFQDRGRGAMLWHMAVLPDHRKKGVAKSLWDYAKLELNHLGVDYCELWTQEDEAANAFYQQIGFVLESSQTWLRCHMEGAAISKLLSTDLLGKIYGMEELVFDAPLERKAELSSICTHMDEVRLYSITLHKK